MECYINWELKKEIAPPNVVAKLSLGNDGG